MNHALLTPMQDALGRQISYLRISVTDKCDLRCVYCMPAEGVPLLSHQDILSYEDMLAVVRLLAPRGLKKVRLTGGEPLVRKNLEALIRGLKEIPGISEICITTNGILLKDRLPALTEAGLNTVNISLDTLDEAQFKAITRREGLSKVLASIDAALSYPELQVKINCVPTTLNRDQIPAMIRRFASDPRLSLRFIELMPIGMGRNMTGLKEPELRAVIESEFGALTSSSIDNGLGPCEYYHIPGLPGKIGFISAISHKFCDRCNRIRLTADGYFKTCLQFQAGVDLKPFLQAHDEEGLLNALLEGIAKKPKEHAFGEKTKKGELEKEERIMSQIGG